MTTIDVDGLPEPVIHWRVNMVDDAAAERLPPGEELRRAAGSWADADPREFDTWLAETYKARKMDRAELN